MIDFKLCAISLVTTVYKLINLLTNSILLILLIQLFPIIGCKQLLINAHNGFFGRRPQ